MGHRAMRVKPPRWTHVYTDRHGKLTCYLRQPGHRKVRLPGLPWSPEFMEARELALKGDSGKVDIGASRTVAGTVSAALVNGEPVGVVQEAGERGWWSAPTYESTNAAWTRRTTASDATSRGMPVSLGLRGSPGTPSSEPVPFTRRCSPRRGRAASPRRDERGARR